jgi:hypothetical protein
MSSEDSPQKINSELMNSVGAILEMKGVEIDCVSEATL